VFVIVAIKAQQFPVTPIKRIVIVIVVTVVNSQFWEVLKVKFSRTATADSGVEL